MRTDPRINMVGWKIGEWLVLSYAGAGQWLCRCKCGLEKPVDGASLRGGTSSMCPKCSNARGLRRTHGGCGTKLYRVWAAMLGRCLNPSDPHYADYGGRGITVCERWRGKNGFANFRRDMGPRPSDAHSVDRRDNDGPYCPENCGWATDSEQQLNQRRNRLIPFRGQMLPLMTVARAMGIRAATLRARLEAGRTVEEAVTAPVLQKGPRPKNPMNPTSRLPKERTHDAR